MSYVSSWFSKVTINRWNWLLFYIILSVICLKLAVSWVIVIVATAECTVWRWPGGQKVSTISLVHRSQVHLLTTAGMQCSSMATGSWSTATGQRATFRLRGTHQRALSMSTWLRVLLYSTSTPFSDLVKTSLSRFIVMCLLSKFL